MMTNLVKRLITNLRYPLQVIGKSEDIFESAVSSPMSRPQEHEEILQDWDDYEFLTGYDLYSLDDDNCSFHLFEEEDDLIEGYEEDVF